MKLPCPKIDTHLHLLVEEPTGDTAKKFSGYRSMVPHLEELNIVKGVVLPGGESSEFLGTNEDARAIAQGDPVHYAWMCNLDPVDPDTVYDRLACYKQQGAIGIGELVINRRLDDPFLCAVFDAAGKLGLPITFHMSPQENYSYGVVDDPGLPLLEKVLQAYPDTVFVGHSSAFWIEISPDFEPTIRGRQAYGKGPVQPGGRIPELMEKYPNLYCDLSAGSAGNAILRDEEFGLSFLERFHDRLFFATDMTNVNAVFPLGAWLDEQAAKGTLSMEAYENICTRNAQRIYGLRVSETVMEN